MKKTFAQNCPDKPRRGRPIATNPKVARIQICLTLDELATITEAAGNVRVSEWARHAITAACQK
jgi:hypothetical protein